MLGLRVGCTREEGGTTALGGILEALEFHREVRVWDVLHGESVLLAYKGFFGRIEFRMVLYSCLDFLVRQVDYLPSLGGEAIKRYQKLKILKFFILQIILGPLSSTVKMSSLHCVQEYISPASCSGGWVIEDRMFAGGS